MNTLAAIARIATTRNSREVMVVACHASGGELSVTWTAIVACFPPLDRVIVPDPPETPAANDARFPGAA